MAQLAAAMVSFRSPTTLARQNRASPAQALGDQGSGAISVQGIRQVSAIFNAKPRRTKPGFVLALAAGAWAHPQPAGNGQKTPSLHPEKYFQIPCKNEARLSVVSLAPLNRMLGRGQDGGVR